MACRTGCRTKDHANWGDCARAARMQLAPGETAPGQYTTKSWDSELELYREARRQGIQPEGTTMPKIRAALDASDRLGRAYDGEKDMPARAITEPTAKVLNEIGA